MKSTTSRRLLLVATFLVLAFLFASMVYATNISIERWVLSGGGGEVSDSSRVLRSGIGQPLAGTVSDGQTTLCAGLACGGEQPVPTIPGISVEVRNFEFVSDVITITVGETVTWVRIEGTHNVVADDGSFSSGPASNTWLTFAHTFTETGTFPYYCELHGGPGGQGMSGVVIVQEKAPGEEPFKIYLPIVVQ